jgi:hypothetical protein
VRRIAAAALIVAMALGVAWAAAALAIDAPTPLGSVLAAAVAIAGCVTLVAPIGLGRRVVVLAVIVAAVASWWFSLEPRNDRDWLGDVARAPRTSLDGDRLTIESVRNFSYRSDGDYDEHWETRSFDLSKLRGADLFLSYWGSPWIAHTIASFEFEEGPALAISIETRKEKGESYSALLGFFRRYELVYVAADERDVIGVRTNHRGEDTYLYRVAMPLDRARALLVDYAEDMNRLADSPRWYNAGTTNCTTGIRERIEHLGGRNPWDWRILVNGKLDELMYERGTIDHSRPFPQVRRASSISERAREADGARDFSARIRDGLPPRPAVEPVGAGG